MGIARFADRETLVVSRGPLSLANRMRKRALDLAVTLLGLVFLGLLLPAVALTILVDSPGPVLFRQGRIGQGNRKFRSMYVDRGARAGNRSTSRHDDRIMRYGHFIRATSMNELP